MFGLSTADRSDPAVPRGDCGCRPSQDSSRLLVDAESCPGNGHLAGRPACRATIVDALDGRSATAIAVETDGRERLYRARGRALLVTAGAFARAIEHLDDRLAAMARRDPLAAAREAVGRAGPVADHAAKTGLAAFATRASYEALFCPRIGLAWSTWRVEPTPPADSRLEAVREVAPSTTARVYGVPDRRVRTYHLDPPSRKLDNEEAATLAAAYARLASPDAAEKRQDPLRAVGAVAAEGESESAMAAVLRRHTRAPGLLGALFADPDVSDVSDVFVTAPATSNPLRVRMGGETLETNVYLTVEGLGALASRFRRESGRGFSRAEPTLAAALSIGGRRVRVAGLTEPISDGETFAFRAHERDERSPGWPDPGPVDGDGK